MANNESTTPKNEPPENSGQRTSYRGANLQRREFLRRLSAAGCSLERNRGGHHRGENRGILWQLTRQ